MPSGEATPQSASSSAEAGEVGAGDLGRREGGERALLAAGPEPEAPARRHPPGAAAALLGLGARDPLGHQPGHARSRDRSARRRARPASTTTPHVRDGQRGLGDRGREHQPAALRQRRERGALPVERQAAVQRLDHDVRAAGADARRAAVRAISAWPGRNTSTPPSVSASARSVELRHRLLEARARPGPPRPRPIEPARLDRPGAALGGQHRRAAHQRRDRRGVERGRHHQERRSGRSAPRISSASARPRSACSAALVELVEDHAADARQVGRRTGSSGSGCPRSPPRSRAPATASPRMR